MPISSLWRVGAIILVTASMLLTVAGLLYLLAFAYFAVQHEYTMHTMYLEHLRLHPLDPGDSPSDYMRHKLSHRQIEPEPLELRMARWRQSSRRAP
jgi:hypothetical protein